MRLADFQKRFVRSVLRSKSDPALAKTIRPGGTLPGPAAVLKVHREGYFARLTEQLGETYEAVWSVLGDQKFFQLCREYIRKHPSIFYNLSDYGAEFPLFLEKQKEAKKFPFLPDLALFEWGFKEVFHGAEPLVFTSEYQILPIWRRRAEKEQTIEDCKGPCRLLLRYHEEEVFVQELTQSL
ncbi:MAG: DNA-binding domain-containing protein [Deltaproteobacteria bacterium]|nr:DNA-binding domain-containing protein [Deltaproteobacteria bacterium]